VRLSHGPTAFLPSRRVLAAVRVTAVEREHLTSLAANRPRFKTLTKRTRPPVRESRGTSKIGLEFPGCGDSTDSRTFAIANSLGGADRCVTIAR